MIRKQVGFSLEDVLGAKVPWRLLRVLLERPYLSFSPTMLATALKTSRASVLRVLRRLMDRSLVLSTDGQRYRANTEHEMIRRLWSLFILERRMSLQPAFKNAIEMFFKAVEDDVELFIIFGSVARGLATTESDVDVCVVGQGVEQRRFDFLPYRFEVHTYQRQDLERLADLVILDALLNGIVFKGEEFVCDMLKDLRSFPKEYLLYRLNKAKEFRRRAEDLTGEARTYYTSLAEVAVREVESVLYQGTTLSKPEMPGGGQYDIPELETELARQGERIWLI
jgi:predicted nucleotidyltransferase